MDGLKLALLSIISPLSGITPQLETEDSLPGMKEGTGSEAIKNTLGLWGDLAIFRVMVLRAPLHLKPLQYTQTI